ncbi:class I SAM-dependent methyltransferase [Candidatus Acetothermia bacterium]|jgi:ubiquinone/menaquinone biosynthesis C-methylase UbiE|nr:class I SAM-dependent methyltransferase [Candidatus Acetothermia bacterium]MCI2431050.1 class I SAM-dependent methyltransferase [Candidatus Acetothermia bacterium]MCI2436946.1 class I SAM-dependent methyltransferase [Candidatus Acetothermia bacterium]
MRRLSQEPKPFVPWYLREEIVSSYESWYEGPKGQRMDRLEKKLLRGLLADFAESKNLLEVGCGTAHFTRWFANELGLDVVGVDLSPLMLQEARKYWQGPLLLGDAMSLPFADKSFDVVAFVTSFEYIPDPIKALREAARVSRHGLILGLMNRWSLPTVRRRIQELFGKNPFYKNAHFYSLLEIKRLLSKALGEDLHIRWESTLFPQFLPMESARLPFGAFLGLAVRWEGARRE